MLQSYENIHGFYIFSCVRDSIFMDKPKNYKIKLNGIGIGIHSVFTI